MPAICHIHVALSVILVGSAVNVGFSDGPTVEELDQIFDAAPQQAPVVARTARTLLVFTAAREFVHFSIPHAAAAVRILGEKTGAFDTVVSNDPSVFRPENLEEFDAICFANTSGELFDDPAWQEGLLGFVRGGKGVVGIHAAIDSFHKWPEFGELMGANFDGHPWNEKVRVRIDDPQHPVNAVFGGRAFDIADEIYQFKEPYSRERLHILLSLDTNETDMSRPGIQRADGDFAVSWVRNYGLGRVFYCSLGHREEIFWNPLILQHYLAGIQFALGDLVADATPSALLIGPTNGSPPPSGGGSSGGDTSGAHDPAPMDGQTPLEQIARDGLCPGASLALTALCAVAVVHSRRAGACRCFNAR